MPRLDPDKKREDWRRWYQNNKATHIKRVRAADVKQKERLRQVIAEHKAKGCSRCPMKHPAAIDFHHTEGDKEVSIGNVVKQRWSVARLEKEIAKCILLCANCHRIHHAEE
jgi:hypothetical protein